MINTIRENAILTTRNNDPSQTLITGHRTTLSDENRKALIEKYETLLINLQQQNESVA